ncbi:MAG TPA: phosphatase PAP2 family protein [Clostridia bacterium]|nr:phosphatase PAP2 family protein [Clostridia bacterium]
MKVSRSARVSESIFSRLWHRYWHFSLLSLYGVCQIWFYYLERVIRPEYFMRSVIDNYIPFVRVFVLPYLFWFAYMAIGFLYLGFVSKKDYFRLCWFIFGGMCICYVLYMMFPNAQNLRPDITTNDVFSRMIRHIYETDTNTNVAPSIHVLNSIGVHVALINCEEFKEQSKVWRLLSFISAVLISLSTVFIKQHSIKDVMWAMLLAMVLYLAIYAIPRYLAEGDIFATDTK